MDTTTPTAPTPTPTDAPTAAALAAAAEVRRAELEAHLAQLGGRHDPTSDVWTLTTTRTAAGRTWVGLLEVSLDDETGAVHTIAMTTARRIRHAVTLAGTTPTPTVLAAITEATR